MSNRAIRIYQHGGPEVMCLEDVDTPVVAEHEVLIKQSAIGVNFADIYWRKGDNTPAQMPFTPGFEGAGVIEKIGSQVSHLSVGDRVAYASGPMGAYSTVRTYPANRVVPLPDNITEKQAACMMMRGLTAGYLCNQCYPVTAKDTVLVHAASGGVGQILSQWIRNKDATIIAVVGNADKAKTASENGCQHVLVRGEDDILDSVNRITDNRGVDVVFDSVGQATFELSLDCLKPRGTLVSFGQSSGNIPPFDPLLLAKKGSVFFTRPALIDYIREDHALRDAAQALFAFFSSGQLKIRSVQEYPLEDARQAHADLEAGKTMGSVLLIP